MLLCNKILIYHTRIILFQVIVYQIVWLCPLPLYHVSSPSQISIIDASIGSVCEKKKINDPLVTSLCFFTFVF